MEKLSVEHQIGFLTLALWLERFNAIPKDSSGLPLVSQGTLEWSACVKRAEEIVHYSEAHRKSLDSTS